MNIAFFAAIGMNSAMALVGAAVVIGLTVRVALLLSQKKHVFPRQ